MIKVIIFDVDGVLIDSFGANLKFFQDLMNFAGHTPPTREMYLGMFHMTMRQVIEKLIDDPKEVEKVWTMGRNREVRYPTELITTPPNCENVLKELHKKYRLAIVTSRVKDGVFSLPQLSNLENLFETTVYFEDTQKHKPAPDPLLLACERLSITPAEAIYIGDANTDIQAAKAAEMKILAFKNDSYEADAVAHEFDQIPNIIEKVGS